MKQYLKNYWLLYTTAAVFGAAGIPLWALLMASACVAWEHEYVKNTK